MEVERTTYNTADAVVCLSLDTKQILMKTYKIKPSCIHLIPNGIKPLPFQQESIDSIRKKLHLLSTEKVFLFVGRVTPMKGIEALVKAFSKVIASHHEIKLVIAGNAMGGDINQLAKFSPARICYIGNVSKKELYEWYSVCCAGVLLSYSEQCSYAGIEMLAHGIPVIASDGWGARNMFNESNALIAPIENRKNDSTFVKSITIAIERFLSLSVKEIDVLKRQAYLTYKDAYTIKQMKKQYELLLQNL